MDSIFQFVREEHERRESLMAPFVLLARDRLVPLLDMLDARAEELARYFAEFLEGARFSYEERTELRFLEESLMISGYLPTGSQAADASAESDVTVSVVPLQSKVPADTRNEFFSVMGRLSPLDASALLPEDLRETDTLFDNREVLKAVNRITQAKREPTPEEDELLGILQLWSDGIGGVRSEFFDFVREPSQCGAFVEQQCSRVQGAIEAIDKLVAGAESLDAGRSNVEQFCALFDDAFDEDESISDEDVLEIIGEELLCDLDDALLEADVERQHAGREKRKRGGDPDDV